MQYLFAIFLFSATLFDACSDESIPAPATTTSPQTAPAANSNGLSSNEINNCVLSPTLNASDNTSWEAIPDGKYLLKKIFAYSQMDTNSGKSGSLNFEATNTGTNELGGPAYKGSISCKFSKNFDSGNLNGETPTELEIKQGKISFLEVLKITASYQNQQESFNTNQEPRLTDNNLSFSEWEKAFLDLPVKPNQEVNYTNSLYKMNNGGFKMVNNLKINITDTDQTAVFNIIFVFEYASVP